MSHRDFHAMVRIPRTPRPDQESLDIQSGDERIRDYVRRTFASDVATIFHESGPARIPFGQRRQMQELLTILQAGDVIVAEHLDDVCGSASDCDRLIQQLRQQSADLHLIGVGDIAKGRLAKLAAQLADLDRTRFRERTLDSQAVRRAQKKRVSGSVPFGYAMDNVGYLLEHPEQQKAIERMRQLRAEKKSFRGIATEIRHEFNLSVSPFGIQRIVENKRQIDEHPTPPAVTRRIEIPKIRVIDLGD
jgi:DNA invertase Pin-like site-specific DNA recombinase